MSRYFVGEKILNPRGAPIEISKNEFERIYKSKNIVTGLMSFELKFNILFECYRRLEIEMFEMAFDLTIKDDFSRQISSEIVINLNQNLLSFLTAVRAYHDQRPQDLAAFSTPESPWAEKANGVFHSIFNLIFEYRVMEAVRNHAQHHRLPIERFYTGASRDKTEKSISELRYTIDPEINLIELAKNNKLNKRTREEISELGVEWMDIKLALRRYVSGLAQGHNEVRSMIFDMFEDAKAVYAEFADRYKSRHASDNGAIFVMAYSEPEICEPIYLGLDVIAEVDRMYKLHLSAKNLEKRYVSTEIVRYHPKHPSILL